MDVMDGSRPELPGRFSPASWIPTHTRLLVPHDGALRTAGDPETRGTSTSTTPTAQHRWRGVITKFNIAGRRKFYAAFMDVMAPSAATTILDVGVTPDQTAADSNFFEKWYPHPERITATSIEDASCLEAVHPGLTFVQTVGRPAPVRRRPVRRGLLDGRDRARRRPGAAAAVPRRAAPGVEALLHHHAQPLVPGGAAHLRALPPLAPPAPSPAGAQAPRQGPVGHHREPEPPGRARTAGAVPGGRRADGDRHQAVRDALEPAGLRGLHPLARVPVALGEHVLGPLLPARHGPQQVRQPVEVRRARRSRPPGRRRRCARPGARSCGPGRARRPRGSRPAR